MSGIGHNRGPSMEGGTSWRRHCWTKARSELLPTLPIEVVRLRVKRAKEIGLEYRTYASFRAASGHDIVALLFSSNALRMLPPRAHLPELQAAKLAEVKNTVRAALVRAPLMPASVSDLARGLIDRAAQSPRPFAGWSEARKTVLNALDWPSDRVLMVGDTADERFWSEAASLGAYLPADRYFN